MKTKILASAFGIGALCAPGGAAAQETQPNEAKGLTDIVVTANRREERLQSVPVTVAALSAETLAETHVTKLTDITSSIPSVQILPVFSPNIVIFAIRGQSQQDTTVTLDPSVAVYSDEVYIARAAGALVNMVDLERVEVLNGPQGSLFGRNTTGGAIVMTSKRPTSVFEGWMSARYEQGDQFVGRAVVNLPIVPNLAELRVVGEYLHRGGFTTNAVSGNKLDHDEHKFVRATLALHPATNLDIVVRGDYTDQKAGGIATRMVGFAGGAASLLVTEVMAEEGLLTTPGGRTTAFNLLNAEIAANNANPYNVGTDARILRATQISVNPDGSINFHGASSDPFLRSRTWGLSGTIELDLGAATVRSITAYRNTSTDTSWTLDGSRYAFNEGELYADQHQFSQEVLVNGEGLENRLNWSFGGQYFREVADQIGPSTSLPYLQLRSTGFINGITTAQAVNSSFALFGQGTLEVMPGLKITAGGRYTWDKRSVDGAAFAKYISGTVCSLPGLPTPCLVSNSAKFSRFTYNAAINYEFSSRQMIYARLSTGYRSGGFNARLATPESLLPFRPEKVTEVELGLKAQWLNNRLRTNIAYFHDYRSDIQVTINNSTPVPVIDPLGNPRTVTTSYSLAINAGTAKVDGIDATVDLAPADWLLLSGSWVHMWSIYDSKVAALPFKQTALTPRDSFSISATIKADLIPDKIGFSARADYSYRSPMLTGHFIGYPTMYDARNVVNANIEFVEKKTGVSFSIFGRNLTDSQYLTRTYGVAGLNFQAGATSDPRSYGVELKIPFGAER